MHHAPTTRRARAHRFALGAGLALGAVLGTAAGPASPAAAGGADYLHTVQERYEPGETATMIGYTSAGASTSMPSGDAGDGPYHGRLVADAESGRLLDLGPATVTETGRRDRYAVRLSITFTVPDGLAGGAYEVLVCDATCSRSLGELYGGTVYVGIDPPDGLDRGWLIDDPAVAELPDGALVAGIPVERIRAGEAGVPWYDAGPEPAPAPAAGPRPEPEQAPAPGAEERPVTVADGEDARGGPGLADVAPWLVPLVLVAIVWRFVRRNGGRAVAARRAAARPTAAARPAAAPGSEPAPDPDPAPVPVTDPDTAAPAREPVRL